MPCASWSGLKTPSGARGQARKKPIWLAKIRERNRRNPVASDSRKIRLRQSKRSRGRSGWLTFAGTMGRRISSSPAGNGSPAGAAEPWSTRRNSSAQLSCPAPVYSGYGACSFRCPAPHLEVVTLRTFLSTLAETKRWFADNDIPLSFKSCPGTAAMRFSSES